MGPAEMAQYFNTRYMPSLTRPPHKRNRQQSLLIAGATSVFLRFGWTQPLSICAAAWYRTFLFYFLVISWTSRILQCNASSLHTSEPFSMRQLAPAAVQAHHQHALAHPAQSHALILAYPSTPPSRHAPISSAPSELSRVGIATLQRRRLQPRWSD
jgi:hypothetical protein